MGTDPVYELVTQYDALGIGSLIRRGLFRGKPGMRARGEVRFPGGGSVSFEVDGDRLAFMYGTNGGPMNTWRVGTVTTPTNFGGRRRWFRCPSCDRRAGVLYFSSCGPQCRRCLHLIYPTSRERAFGKRCMKRDRLALALGAEPMQELWYLAKPKGMHWKTFEKKKRQLRAAQEAVALAAGACLAVLRRQLRSS